MRDKKTMAKISIKEYGKIAKVGDVILTNIAGTVKEGKVDSILKSDGKWRFEEKKTGQKHGYFNFNTQDLGAWVKVLNAPPKILSMAKKRKERLVIEVKKLKTGIAIDLKIPWEVENYYKEISKGETSQSSQWYNGEGTGATFYKLNTEMQKEEKGIDNGIYSDFGSGLINSNEEINTAMLRVVGASNGVVITSTGFAKVKNMDLEFYVQRLGEFVKTLYEKSLSEKTVKAIISFEI
jgi:hypothetical protein